MTEKMDTLDLFLHDPGPGYYYEMAPHASFSFLSHRKAKSSHIKEHISPNYFVFCICFLNSMYLYIYLDIWATKWVSVGTLFSITGWQPY